MPRRISEKSACGVGCQFEKDTAAKVGALTDALADACGRLEQAVAQVPAETVRAMVYCHETIIPLMAEARAGADKLETLTDASYWPFPVYSDLMFYV